MKKSRVESEPVEKLMRQSTKIKIQKSVTLGTGSDTLVKCSEAGLLENDTKGRDDMLTRGNNSEATR